MLDDLRIADPKAVEFQLASRSLDDGRTAIVLHLYRGEHRASTSTVSVVLPSAARMMMLLSRAHLSNLGFSEHKLRLPRAANLWSVSGAGVHCPAE